VSEGGTRGLRAPSGHPPPITPSAPGYELDLVALAREICDRYRAEYPDEQERYGEAGVAWCRHDNQHILNWAVSSLEGYDDFGQQIAWLAGVLSARSFPLDRLTRDLELAAEVVENRVRGVGSELAAVLRSGETVVQAE
jgi:hypothetical protein